VPFPLRRIDEIGKGTSLLVPYPALRLYQLRSVITPPRLFPSMESQAPPVAIQPPVPG
jgi:hypothetical protein